jgi:hypothetical protein
MVVEPRLNLDARTVQDAVHKFIENARSSGWEVDAKVRLPPNYKYIIHITIKEATK